MVRLKLRSTYFFLLGYLNDKFLNSILPLLSCSAPVYLGSIIDGSSIIPKTVFAAYFALERDGI